MLSSCTPSEVVRTLRYVFFGRFCYQSSCLLIYLGTGVFIQMLGHENSSKHVVLPRSTVYLGPVQGGHEPRLMDGRRRAAAPAHDRHEQPKRVAGWLVGWTVGRTVGRVVGRTIGAAG